MSDVSSIANFLPVVTILSAFAYGGGRLLPVRPMLLRILRATALTATFVALSFRSLTLWAPNVARAMNPAWYLAELAVVALLVGAAAAACIIDRQLGPQPDQRR